VLDGRLAAELEGLGVHVDRLAGASRYETAVRAREAAGAAGMKDAQTLVSTLRTWPDSLVVGAVAAARGSLVLSVRGTTADGEPSDAYTYARTRGADVRSLTVVGGNAAVSDEVVAAFFDHQREASRPATAGAACWCADPWRGPASPVPAKGHWMPASRCSPRT
jgi:hypothetical protein